MVIKVKGPIIGAGPSVLSSAVNMQQLGENTFLLIDKEGGPGGLCRSKDVDGSLLDIGGIFSGDA